MRGIAIIAVSIVAFGCQERVRQIEGPRGANGDSGDAGPAGLAGANGLTALVVTTAEPQGSNCPAGGTKITNGLDANANGALDATEIANTRFVCNGLPGGDGQVGAPGPAGDAGPPGSTGAAGLPGANGLNALIATSPESAGTNCAAGGVKLEGGLDANRDGALEPAEINPALTRYVCNGLGGASGGSDAGVVMPFLRNVWADADGGFVAWGDAVEYEGKANYSSYNIIPLRLSPVVRYTDARGYIWRVDIETGSVGAWPDPGRDLDDNIGGLYGFSSLNCTGPEFFLPGRGVVMPRFVYMSPQGNYWSRTDSQQLTTTSSIFSLNGGCSGPGSCQSAASPTCPSSWPPSFRAFALSQATPNPPLSKPPDFTGPLHIEPR